ncbi:MAG TPA: hypothetical protein VF636_04450, partial [Sphingomonas sp.]
KALPPEPTDPGSGLPDNFESMSLHEIKALGRDPARKVAWADYERNHAAWKAERDALRDRIVGPAKATNDGAFSAQSQALNALTIYRVRNLRDLGEKIEIIMKDYDGCDIPPEYVADILADVRHLATREG